MRFDFLYDRRRRIFAIGYRLADADGPGRLDGSFYDLLASEARLASFVAIAKGDVPQHHWFHLGRLVTNVDGRATLMSWGGTMFEYLMPLLLMRSFPGHAARSELPRERAAPDRVRRRARRALGHLGVGVRVHRSRGQLPVPRVRRARPRPEARPGRRPRRSRRTRPRWRAWSTPAAAAENFERLARAGLDGRYGFYESLDYSPRNRDVDASAGDARRAARGRARLLRASPGHVARRARQRRLRRRVRRRASTPTRASRRPSCCCRSACRARRSCRSRGRPKPRPAPPSLPVFASRRFRSPHTASAHTQFLSNGRYTTALTNAGGGYSMWRDLAVTRRRDDPTSDAGAHYIYLRDPVVGATSGRPRYQPVVPRARPVRRDVRARQGHVPPPRRRLRDAARDHRVVRRRRRGAAADDHQPRRADRARSRSRATPRSCWRGPKTTSRTRRSASCSSRPSSTRRAPACSSAAGRARPTRRRSWAFHVLGVDGPRSAAPSNGRPIARASSAAAARRPTRSALDGRALSGTTGAVLDPIGALRERSGWRPGAFVRVTFATGVAPDRADGAGAGAQVSRRQRRRARLLDGVHARAHHAAAPRPHRRPGHPVRSAGVARVRRRTRRASARPISRANTLGQPNLWGYGISGDLPIVLVRVAEHRRRCRWCGSCCTRRSTGASRGCAPTS